MANTDLHRYFFKKVHNRRGYRVGLDLTFDLNQKEFKLELLDKYIGEFKLGLETGFEFFSDYYYEKTDKKIQITVHLMEWFPMETSSDLVCYFFIRTLCHFFDFDFLEVVPKCFLEQFHFLNELSFQGKENVYDLTD